MSWPAIDSQFTRQNQLTLYPAVVETTELSSLQPNSKAVRYLLPHTVWYSLYQKQQWIDYLLMFTCIWIEKAQRIHPIIHRIEFT